nr:shikimate kinase [Miniphocaeibacter halophilus]
MEKAKKMSIPQIFESEGEEGFRKIEKELTHKFSRKTGVVISTGGGVVLDEENYNPLKQNGFIVLVEREIEKLSTQGRPLSQGGINRLIKLKEERQSKYEDFSDIKVNNIYLPNAVDEIVEAFNENPSN